MYMVPNGQQGGMCRLHSKLESFEWAKKRGLFGVVLERCVSFKMCHLVVIILSLGIWYLGLSYRDFAPNMPLISLQVSHINYTLKYITIHISSVSLNICTWIMLFCLFYIVQRKWLGIRIKTNSTTLKAHNYRWKSKAISKAIESCLNYSLLSIGSYSSHKTEWDNQTLINNNNNTKFYNTKWSYCPPFKYLCIQSSKIKDNKQHVIDTQLSFNTHTPLKPMHLATWWKHDVWCIMHQCAILG